MQGRHDGHPKRRTLQAASCGLLCSAASAAPVAFCGINGRQRCRFRSSNQFPARPVPVASTFSSPSFCYFTPGFADMAHYLTTQFVQLPRMQSELKAKNAQRACCCLTDAPATEIGAKMSPGCTPWICIDHRSAKCQIGGGAFIDPPKKLL